VDGSYWLNQLASSSADGTTKVLPLSPKIMASTKVPCHHPIPPLSLAADTSILHARHQSLYRPKEIVALQVSLNTRESQAPVRSPSLQRHLIPAGHATDVSLPGSLYAQDCTTGSTEVITLRSLPPEDATKNVNVVAEPSGGEGSAGEPGEVVRRFPDPRLAVQRTKWNPNLPASGWLLSGTTAGLLHGLLLNQTVL
jgi:hypothetical protein